jgi:glycosyltransferase involved in cell wall biosynthesis
MKIAIMTTRLTEHDAQGNFTAATINALKEKGADVAIYTFAYERPPVKDVSIHFLGGKNKHSISSNILSSMYTIRHARELSKYDMLLLAGPDIGAIPAAHLARKYNPNIMVFWVYHGLTPEEFLYGIKDRWLTKIRRLAYLASMKRSDIVQVFSGHIRDELIGKGIIEERIIVKSLGVDISKFTSGNGQRIRKKYALEDKFIILYVGRLTILKRVDELIQALSRLKDKNIALLVVGSGPERENLERQSKSLKIDDRVIFTGKVDDSELPDYYAACNVWATASRHEGFCVPIIEAMASGKPVIVPDVAAMPETAGEGGLIYRAGDIGGLVNKINSIMADKGIYSSLTEKARSRALLFEYKKVLSAYADMIISEASR